MERSLEVGASARPPRLGRWIAEIPKLVVALMLLAAIGNLLVGVFLRYVMVEVTDYLDRDPISFFWVEETGEFLLAWMTLIGAAIGIQERSHFTLSLIVPRLPARVQHGIFVFNHIVIGVFGLLAAWQGWKLSVLNSTLTSPGLGINLGWLYFASVIGGGLIALYGFALAFGLAKPTDGSGHDAPAGAAGAS